MTAAAAHPPAKSWNRQELADIVSSEVKKRFDPLEGVIKSLGERATKANTTPEAMIAAASQGGNVPVMLHSSGQLMPVFGVRDPYKKGVGWGRWLKAVAKSCKPDFQGITQSEAESIFKEYGPSVEKAALMEASGTTGGYTVPPQFVSQLLTLSVEESIVRPRATIMPMASATMQIPALDVTTVQSAGTTPFLGGIVGTWTAEGQTRTESEPTFKQVTLTAHELSLYTIASNNLLADNAIGLDGLLTQLFSTAIGWYTDFAYFQGNGAGRPLGIINAPATISVNRGTPTTFKFADAANMLSKLYFLLARGSQVAWVISPTVIPQLLQMVDAGNRVVFIPLSSGVQAPLPQSAGPMSLGSLFGLPVIVSEKLPALGTAGDVLLCDFSKYLLGDRMDIQIDVSPHVKFLQNQMVWRVVWRGDGQPWMSSYVTLQDGSSTVSAFVKLN